jgi:hypothetical protein
MSLVNDSLLVMLGQEGFTNQECTAPNANSQNTGFRATAPVLRVTGGVANGSVVLPSQLSNEAANPIGWIINDSGNTIKLFPASGENQNGTLNASLSISNGQSAFYFKEPAVTGKGGGTVGTTNWHSSTLS